MSASANSTPLRVLVVDDEKNIRATLSLCLEGSGCVVVEASGLSEALEEVHRAAFDVAFVDLRLGSENGLDLIPQLLAVLPVLDIVVVTAFATIDTAVEAMRRGARDYLPKPFSPAQIRHLVDKLRERLALSHQVFDLKARLGDATPEIELTTRAAAMRAALERSQSAREGLGSALALVDAKQVSAHPGCQHPDDRGEERGLHPSDGGQGRFPRNARDAGARRRGRG